MEKEEVFMFKIPAMFSLLRYQVLIIHMVDFMNRIDIWVHVVEKC